MEVDLRKYIAIIPTVKRMYEANRGSDMSEIATRAALATEAPIIVVNRMMTIFYGEIPELEKQLIALTQFYGYGNIIGEEEIKKYADTI